MQATRIRPDTRPTDLRRLAAAGLSALIPGLGQLYNGHRRLAALFLIPSLILLVLGVLVIQTQSPARLAAWIASPQVLGTLLTINLLVLVWRLVAAGQRFTLVVGHPSEVGSRHHCSAARADIDHLVAQ